MLKTLRCNGRYDRNRSGARGSLALGTLLVLAAPAWAAGEATGRYTMSPTEGGVIRLDRETGAMSFCTGKDGAWSCKEMPESENDLAQRVEELERENRALRGQVERGAALPPANEPPAAGDLVPPAPPGDLPVPTERDVDKLFDYVEGMVRKFKERIDRLEREAQKEPDLPL
ncbi:hypothetical protein [Hyphomicrobium sp.]|uniref:hypothetical protein n=1 Tax=Hyphomicrobium sp. TaxID=82 RepID=UPI002C47A961|nr:hypothetical protein [Hyphomicrobium sp.]HRN84295.1 hypothetical protein [Hyphomicrobium sp.]HRN88055.1 hypothetical protein [Hyphomicrobium sp.]HRQ25694.1 hypothetical protein [Hyphomicrobium sp.]